MIASGACFRSWRTGSLLLAIIVAAVGIAVSPEPGCWAQPVMAVAVAVLAQAGAVRFRQSNRMIYFGWGEAALIIVAFLLPSGWVPVTIGFGAAVGQCLYRLRTGMPVGVRIAFNAGHLTLAALAGTMVAHAVAGSGLDTITPRSAAGAALGAGAYCLVGASFVNLGFATSVREFLRADARTLASKLPMGLGSVALGIGFIVVFQHHRESLLAMPVVLALMHQAYLYRSRAVDERRIWREFADVTRSLNQLDDRGVVIAAVAGVQRMFAASVVEVWVDRLAGSPGGYRSTLMPSGGVDTIELDGRPVDHPVPPGASHPLTIGGSRVGEIRVWPWPGTTLARQERMALAAVAETVAGALHDASAHRAVRVLSARRFHDAHHDVVTGLPNRSTLVLGGDDALAGMAPEAPVALLVLGLNRFKDVNDTLGHRAGDEFLHLIASRLDRAAGAGDLVARLIGDVFAVLVTAPDPGVPIIARAHRIAALVAAPAEVAGVALAVEVAIGVATATAGDYGIGELLRRADVAMHRAKRAAATVAVYGEDPDDALGRNPDRLSVVLDLREAIRRSDQLVLDVLPTLDLDTGAPRGGEALIRWHHPRRGLLAPADFVDIIDASDLVAPFTRYVLDRALALAAGWAAAGLALPVSVNLSPRSVADPDLPGDIAAMLEAYAVPASMLILEITEGAVLTYPGIVDDVLDRLRRLGVQIAVDDFGTGYSSLTFLARVRVDEVKVDSSFVGAMLESPEAAAIVRTTLDLGRRLGVRVVAEGVESAAQRAALRALGCVSAQGRHLVAPIGSALTGRLFRELAATAVPDRVFPLGF
jgi:diguanylate cyclase